MKMVIKKNKIKIQLRIRFTNQYWRLKYDIGVVLKQLPFLIKMQMLL